MAKKRKPDQARDRCRLTPGDASVRVDVERLAALMESECDILDKIIGQERAIEAITFGLSMESPGYNIYVAGGPGMGRDTAVKRYLEGAGRGRPTGEDLCYVHNFSAPDSPLALTLPAGRGAGLVKDVEALLSRLRDEIPKAFEGGDYKERLEEIKKGSSTSRDEVFAKMEEAATKRGFLLKRTSMGIITIPTWEGQPIDEKRFRSLSAQVREKIKEEQEALNEELNSLLEELQGLEDELHGQVAEVDEKVVLFAVGRHIDRLLEAYEGLDEVVDWLKSLQEDVIAHADDFRQEEGGKIPFLPGVQMAGPQPDLRRYVVNSMVDRTGEEGVPIVIERNPTYGHLVGRIDRRVEMGMMYTDHTMIRAGALHRANGGYLVIHAMDLFRHPMAWDGLKRALRDEQIVIEDLAEMIGYSGTKSIEPVPVGLDVKVVMIGNPFIYHLLRRYDEDFAELFKVRADFDEEYAAGDDSLKDYACFVATRVQEEGLLPFTPGGCARLYELGVRLADDKEKVSTKFAEVTDLVREAHQLAKDSGVGEVGRVEVQEAWDRRRRREGMVPDKMREMITRDKIMVETDGDRVGCVNGLAVYTLGGFRFGKPSRITVNTFQGKGRVGNIEREADLSGSLHTKGLLILQGWLNETFGQRATLPMSATITFEQSYGTIDGDSASSTELYGLLSSLSGLPISQGIAVTGSVNQKGDVQPIGGVNEKVEGFFDVCAERGLTGDQGVLIPIQNVDNLVLAERVVEAIEAGKFNVWAVSTIEEGIEILTGRPAGAFDESADSFVPDDGVFALVAARLESYREAAREEARRARGKNGNGNDDNGDGQG